MNNRQKKKFEKQFLASTIRAFCLSPKENDIIVFQFPMRTLADTLRFDDLRLAKGIISTTKRLFPNNRVLFIAEEFQLFNCSFDQFDNLILPSLKTLTIPSLPKEREDEIKTLIQKIRDGET